MERAVEGEIPFLKCFFFFFWLVVVSSRDWLVFQRHVTTRECRTKGGFRGLDQKAPTAREFGVYVVPVEVAAPWHSCTAQDMGRFFRNGFIAFPLGLFI